MSTPPVLTDGSAIELVIFDCDGVLVDSEPVSNAVFADMLREIGLDLTLDQMFAGFVGLSMASCMDEIARRLGRPPPAGFADELRRRQSEALAREVLPVEGVEAVLDTLSLPCCVASSGDHSKMRLTLGRTGLLPRFEGRLFSATEVAHGKPRPDLFLHAAAAMGAEPARCVVIEDSVPGVIAGIAAGMRVLGFAARTPAARLRAAGATVFHHMRELPAHLGAPRRSRRA